MDNLKLKIIYEKDEIDPSNPDLETINYIINGTNFIDLVQEFELPFWEAEGHAGHKSGYQGLESADVLPPSKLLLGKPGPIYQYQEWTQILIDDCREPGCWPLLAKITVDDTKVTWSDFEQPHRGPKSHHFWNYDKFGPFVFDRKHYEEALKKSER